MKRRAVIFGILGIGVAACSSGTSARIGPDGLPLPQVYRIGPEDTADIQFRMLDSVNALRQAAGVGPVELDAQLNAAAATHARDMAVLRASLNGAAVVLATATPSPSTLQLFEVRANPCWAPNSHGPKEGKHTGTPPRMALDPSRMALELTKRFSRPATFQETTVAP